MATELPRFDYGFYYSWLHSHLWYGNTQARMAQGLYFKPSVDCFPLHLGKAENVLLQTPSLRTPMDVVFVTKGHTNSSFQPFNVDVIEWLIPVDFPSVTLTDDFADPKVEASLFHIDGTVDHPELPTAEPINIGCKWVHDTRLVYGTLLEFRMDSMGDHIATPKPDAKNLKVLLVARARARDNPYAEPDKPDKAIDASFLLKGVRTLAVPLAGAQGEDRSLSGAFRCAVWEYPPETDLLLYCDGLYTKHYSFLLIPQKVSRSF